MKITEIEENLKKRLKASESAIQYAESKLKNAPEGKLNVKLMQGKARYFRRITRKDIYLSPETQEGQEAIRTLQEKAYLQELKKVAEHETSALKRIQKIESTIKTHSEVYFTISQPKKTLIKPYISPEIEEVKHKIEIEARNWEKENTYRRSIPKDINLITLNGERVRSKSELIIADRLKIAEIPYYYEAQYVFMNDNGDDFETWFPDFRIMNPRTGEQFFWEHFGIMDNPEYCASCQYKLETYARHGIIMGKNLIVTMESSKHGLNVEYIDTLINEFLK